jgi:secondary thiamine-phosphate synthase enzyme
MIFNINIITHARIEFQDITGKIKDIIKNSGVTSGVCFLFAPHTTAALMINEHADPNVVEDIATQLEQIAPKSVSYRHTEGNSPAHAKASLIGESKFIFIEEGRPVLGEWQGIFFCELDGPRNRKLMVKVVKDK